VGFGGGRFITDADGTFVEFGLVGPRCAGQLFAYIPSYFGGATKASAATLVEAAATETKPNIDITIHTQPAVMIHGTVTGPDGPIDDATLQLTNDDWDAFTIVAASGPGGRYEFVAVPRGVYTLTARRTESPRATVLSAEGYPQLPQYDAFSSGAPMTISVNATVNAAGAAEMNVDVRMQGVERARHGVYRWRHRVRLHGDGRERPLPDRGFGARRIRRG
jgi:hypothetical protein